MFVIRARNVNDAYVAGLRHLREVGQPMASRAGDVIVSPYPVTVVYERPCERVLFDAKRNANPFFHFFEALWLLAGRDDGRWLDRFVHDFSKRFSDYYDGRLHGSYGARWRSWGRGPDSAGLDQIGELVGYLKVQPFGRRAVLQMWDPGEDLFQDEEYKDVPCNTQVYFRAVYGERDRPNRLNMTVTCRSGDVIWGTFGANIVQFSVLQEYMAARLGYGVGTFTHVVNNFHAYVAVLDKVGRPEPEWSPYDDCTAEPFPLVEDSDLFDANLNTFMNHPDSISYPNRFFHAVARPLWNAHVAWKEKNENLALEILSQCEASDWRLAATRWIGRRAAKRGQTA